MLIGNGTCYYVAWDENICGELFKYITIVNAPDRKILIDRIKSTNAFRKAHGMPHMFHVKVVTKPRSMNWLGRIYTRLMWH